MNTNVAIARKQDHTNKKCSGDKGNKKKKDHNRTNCLQ